MCPAEPPHSESPEGDSSATPSRASLSLETLRDWTTRWKQADQTAVDELYADFQKRVVSYLRGIRYVGDAPRRNMVAECEKTRVLRSFMHCVEHGDFAVQGRGRLWSWLLMGVYKKAPDPLDCRPYRLDVEGATLSVGFRRESGAEWPDLFRRALDGLGDDAAKAFRLCCAGCSSQEMSRILGIPQHEIPLNNTIVRLRRLLRKGTADDSSVSSTTIYEWLEGWKNGDKWAESLLYTIFRQRLVTYVRGGRLIGRALRSKGVETEGVVDLALWSFLKSVETGDFTFQGRRPLWAWLCKAVRHKILKKKPPKKPHPEERPFPEGDNGPSQVRDERIARDFSAEWIELFRWALKGLGDVAAEVFYQWLCGYSQRDIAKSLGIPKDRVARILDLIFGRLERVVTGESSGRAVLSLADLQDWLGRWQSGESSATNELYAAFRKRLTIYALGKLARIPRADFHEETNQASVKEQDTEEPKFKVLYSFLELVKDGDFTLLGRRELWYWLLGAACQDTEEPLAGPFDISLPSNYAFSDRATPATAQAEWENVLRGALDGLGDDAARAFRHWCSGWSTSQIRRRLDIAASRINIILDLIFDRMQKQLMSDSL